MDQKALIEYMETEMNPTELWKIAQAGSLLLDAQFNVIENCEFDSTPTLLDLWAAAQGIVQDQYMKDPEWYQKTLDDQIMKEVYENDQ